MRAIALRRSPRHREGQSSRALTCLPNRTARHVRVAPCHCRQPLHCSARTLSRQQAMQENGELTDVAYLDDVLQLVLRALEGNVLALMRAYAVNTSWRRVCSLPTVWSAVQWWVTAIDTNLCMHARTLKSQACRRWQASSCPRHKRRAPAHASPLGQQVQLNRKRVEGEDWLCHLPLCEGLSLCE